MKAAKKFICIACAAAIAAGAVNATGFCTLVTKALAAEDAVIDYDYYTNADYALVDTENLYDVSAESDSPNYRNGIRVQKTNKIILNRIDNRHDPERTTGSIVIEKTTSDDAHYDFNSLNSHDMGYFPYYYYEGRVRAVLLGAPIRPAFFRDTVTKSSNLNIEPFSIDSKGKVTTSTGKTVKTLKQNEWLNFKLVLDTKNNLGRLYIDDALVDDDISLGGLKTVCMLRIWVDTDGTATPCTAEFDQLKLLGMRHDYDPANPDFHPPFFSDDTGIISWLSGGDKTVFYGYSQNVFANGQKHIRVDKPLYGKDYNHILYVSAKALGTGYGLTFSVDAAAKTASSSGIVITAGSKTVICNGTEYELQTECLWQNGTVYVPVESFAKTVLKHDVKSDVNGLVITSATPFVLDTTEEVADYLIQVAGRSGYKNNVKPIKALNWFMSFERPTAATLKADFAAVTGDGASGHPRLIGTKTDFDYIRNNWQTDTSLSKMVNDIINKADSNLSASCPTYALPDGQRILSQARMVLEYFRNLGFAYQITGDDKYAEKVWELLYGVLSYPDWNPSHMIDTAELVGGCAIGFDWCYDYFDEPQKKWIYEKVYHLGMKPINDAAHDIITTRYEWAGANDYVASKSNFNTVINGSQLLGVTAFAELDPDFCFNAMADALRSMEYTMLVYRPDGIWMESPSYWEYAATYVSRGLSSVINATGNHYGFMDAQGINSTSRWFVSQNSYAGINNFHDAGAGNYRPAALAFFGKLQNDKVISAIAEDYAVSKRSANVEDALWYVPDNNATIDELPLDLYYEGFDTVGSRSSYSDTQGFFYATHGGQVTCYHSQYDVCTFVMDLMGVRWAYDLGSDDYNVRRDQNGFNKMYRDIAEGHNVMVFNQSVPGQVNAGCAQMTKWHSEKGGSIAIYDVTSVYSDWVTNATRGFLVGDNRTSLTIRDEFTPNADMPAHWFMCTPADVQIVNNNYAILSKNGKQLKMEVLTNVDDYSLTAGAAQPLPTSPQIAGQDANEGYSRIAVELNVKANQNCYVMVKLSPYMGQTTDINYSNMPASEWTVDGLSTITDSSKVLNFDSFKQNTNYADSDFKVDLRQDAFLYPEFCYNKAMGAYGKAANDAALQLTMTPGMTHGNTAETTSMASVSEISKTTVTDGEYYELEFDLLRSGTGKYKEVRIVNDNWKGNPAYLLRIDTGGGVMSPYLGLDTPIYTLNKNLWCNFRFVIKANNSGEDTVSTLKGNTVDTALNEHDYWMYVNNVLVSSGKFRNNTRTDKDVVLTANHFTGIKQLLFLNYTDAAQNTLYTNTNPSQLLIDNISISSYGEKLTHGIDFDGYTSTTTDDFKNEVKVNKGSWRGSVNTASFYDMYTQKGVFGRSSQDASFVSTVNADEIDYNRIELVEPGFSQSITSQSDITAPKLNYGEFYDFEISMAYTGTGTTCGVQGFFTNNSATDGKQYGYVVAIAKETGSLTAFGKNYPDIVFEQGKWYKFNVVIHSGNDNALNDNYKNWYKIYVNNELVVDKTVFNVNSQRSPQIDTYNKFMGFQKLWVGTVNDGTYNAEVPDRGYFDDISVTYCGANEPAYTPVHNDGIGTITDAVSDKNWATGENNISFVLECPKDCVVAVAGYDELGKLASIGFGDANNDFIYADGAFTQTANVVFDMKSNVKTVKAFVLASIDSIKPVATAKIIK